MLSEILHIAGKVGKVGVHGQLMYFLVLAGPEMNKSCILTQTYNLGVPGVMNTGIGVHYVSLLTQFASQFPDVDTHTTGILGSQVAYRTAMHAEHSYSQLTVCHQISRLLVSPDIYLTIIQGDFSPAQVVFVGFAPFEKVELFLTLLDTLLDTEDFTK